MEFGTIDPAALIFAILAILITIEQLARASENILYNDFKKTISHICAITLHGGKGLNHYMKLNKKYYTILIEKGFTPWEMTMNGNHPAQSRLWKKIWSGIFISLVAKLLRKRIVFLAFIISSIGYVLTIPLRLWMFYLFNFTKCYPWNKRTIIKWAVGTKHMHGYNGQQFDKFIILWLSQLGWTSNQEMTEVVTWVAYLASWTGNSKVIGPTCAVRLAIGEEITIDDIIADSSLFINSINVFYIDKDIRAYVNNGHEIFTMILNPPKVSKNNTQILKLIYQWEYKLNMIDKIWWLPHNKNLEYNKIIKCDECLNDDCTIGRLPLLINDINDIKEYDKFYLGITPILDVSKIRYE